MCCQCLLSGTCMCGQPDASARDMHASLIEAHHWLDPCAPAVTTAVYATPNHDAGSAGSAATPSWHIGVNWPLTPYSAPLNANAKSRPILRLPSSLEDRRLTTRPGGAVLSLGSSRLRSAVRRVGCQTCASSDAARQQSGDARAGHQQPPGRTAEACQCTARCCASAGGAWSALRAGKQQHVLQRLNWPPRRPQAAAAELVVPTPDLMVPKYCESIHQARRRPTRTVTVRGAMAGRHAALGARQALRAFQRLAGPANC